MIPRLDLPARRRTNDVRQARQSSWPEPRVKSGLTEFSKRPWFYILGVVFHYVNSWLSSKRLRFDPVALCVRYSGGGQGPEIGHIDQRENTAARFGRRLDAEEVCAMDIVNDEPASFGNLLRI